jgi:hypothetical protein
MVSGILHPMINHGNEVRNQMKPASSSHFGDPLKGTSCNPTGPPIRPAPERRNETGERLVSSQLTTVYNPSEPAKKWRKWRRLANPQKESNKYWLGVLFPTEWKVVKFHCSKPPTRIETCFQHRTFTTSRFLTPSWPLRCPDLLQLLRALIQAHSFTGPCLTGTWLRDSPTHEHDGTWMEHVGSFYRTWMIHFSE